MSALSGVRMADGKYADGSWELKITVTDMKIINEQGDVLKTVVVPVLVTNELHIGGVIYKLIEILKQKYGKCNVFHFIFHLYFIFLVFLCLTLCYTGMLGMAQKWYTTIAMLIFSI